MKKCPRAANEQRPGLFSTLLYRGIMNNIILGEMNSCNQDISEDWLVKANVPIPMTND
jgi:hypothetical protein